MEKNKTLQQDIAKAKIKIIISSICEAIILMMVIYIMINYKGYFVAMAFGILCMVVGLFFLISGVMDVTMKNKVMEAEKYEDIYNAQKASYLVIRKSFEEMDARLKNIEENSAIPAEEIISAQKAVAKVTISRSKENTDALMNSNDELINQLFAIQEKMDSSNNELLEKQQALLNATRDDLQHKIAELTAQISNIEAKIGEKTPAPAYQPVYSQPQQQGVSLEPVTEMKSSEPITEMIFPEPVAEVVSPESVIESPLKEAEAEPSFENVSGVEPRPEFDIDVNSLLSEMTEAHSELLTEEQLAGGTVEEQLAGGTAEERLIPDEEPAVTDEVVDEEPAVTDELVDKEPVEKPASIPTDLGVDLSDPNRVMSPEEIEKLFASL